MSIRIRPWLTVLSLGSLGSLGCDNSDVVANQIDSAGMGGSNVQVAGAGASGSDAKSGAGNEAGSNDSGGGGNTSGRGGSGAAGTNNGGNAGMQPPPSPNCDDGNPCTADAFVSGGCKHDAILEGQPCEDGNFCTLGDHCASGTCVSGAPQTGPALELGRLQGYGTTGSVAITADDRVFFTDEVSSLTRITQAQVVDGELRRQGTVDVPIEFYVSDFSQPPLLTAWDDFVAIGDSDSSIEINGTPRQVMIVSTTASGELTARGSIGLATSADSDDALTSLTGRGKRLFVCSNFSFFSAPQGTLHWIDLTDPDAPVEVARGAVGSECGSIAASEDGTRVYLNTTNGVRYTDLSTWSGSGDLTFAPDVLVPTDSSLSVRGDKLLIRSAETFHVFDEPTRTELQSFTVTGTHGAGLTDSGIFVEGSRTTSTGAEYFTSLYSFAGERSQDHALAFRDYVRYLGSVKPAVGGQYAVASLNHQIFDLAHDFQPVPEPEVGSFLLVSRGPDAVHAHGPFSTQRIDLSDPAHPRSLGGGPDLSSAFDLRLDETSSPAVLVPENDSEYTLFADSSFSLMNVSAAYGHTNNTLLERVTVDENEHYVSHGTIQLAGGDSRLLSAGDFLYRTEQLGTGVHIQRWLLSDLQAGITTPALDLSLGTAKDQYGFDVDPVARTAVLATDNNFYWLDLSGPSPVVTTTKPAHFNYRLKIRGQRVALTDGTNVIFAERDSDQEQVVPNVDSGFNYSEYVQDVLGFDGNVAYVGMIHNLAIVSRNAPVDQAVIGTIEMRTMPISLAATNTGVVIGSESELLSLSPHCE